MKRIFIIIYLTIVSASLMAQDDAVVQKGGDINVTREAEDLFVKLMPKKDSSFIKVLEAAHRDKFGKRFSLHFNMLEWALTLPNMGIEFDLKPSDKNNRSILLYGKLNPKLKHNYNPEMVFNEMGARVEFRKYWRTGSVGAKKDYQYKRIHLKTPKGYQPDTATYQIENLLREIRLEEKRHEYEAKGLDYKPSKSDTLAVGKEAYQFTHQDSMLINEYNGNPYRSWLYNRYHQFRRNVTSGRTLRHPRDWRAYYLGAYAAVDKWNICFNKQGKQGLGASLGMSLGWSIPMLTRKFPNEGGLDLELGALIGPRVLKYDAYKYVTESACYEYDAAKSKPTWHISMNPIQEVRISFVYRFRSISHKVSRSIIDDYEEKWIKPFNETIRNRAFELRDSLYILQARRSGEVTRAAELKDSASYADWWHKRRLENAKKINPDTVFTGLNDTLYNRLFKGIDLRKKADVKRLEQQQEEQRKADEKLQREADKAAREAAREAEKAAKEDGKAQKKNKKKKDEEQPVVDEEQPVKDEEQPVVDEGQPVVDEEQPVKDEPSEEDGQPAEEPKTEEQ